MPNSVWPHRRQRTRLCHPWDSPGKNTGVGCHFFLQEPLRPPPYIPLPRGHTLMLYEVSKSLPQPMVSLGDLDITKPHPDTSREGWGAIHMICWEKRGIFKATKGLSKLICHPHLSKSTQMGHMAVRVCLLQTCSCRTIQGFILFSLTLYSF